MIFINYRRADAGGYALLIYKELQRSFPRRVFIDSGGELSGRGDFTRRIFDEIERSRLVLCLIGSDWPSIKRQGHRRLDLPDDLVRRELDFAIQRRRTVLPVLINGARMPLRNELPDCISDIPRYDAAHFRHETFETDIIELMKSVRRALKLSNANTSSRGNFSSTPIDELSSGLFPLNRLATPLESASNNTLLKLLSDEAPVKGNALYRLLDPQE